MTAPLRVVDFIVEQLAAFGTDHVFGVDGANIEDLYDAIHRHDCVTGIVAKHEFSAATMADGYSRAGAALGIVVATSGGASLNLLAGLGESRASRIPVLAVVGQPPMFLGSIDAEAVFSAVALHCARITVPGDIVTALPVAIAAARTGGPAVLLIPKDIQQAALPATAAAVASPLHIAANDYLMRVIDAQVVLNKPGSVVLWTNCRHPFYDHNPYPEAAPAERPVWVGDFWDMFGAGHELELKNLKAIAEYRHHNGLPVTPYWMK